MKGRDHLNGVGAVDRDLRQLLVAEGLLICEAQGGCSEAERAAHGWFSDRCVACRLHGRSPNLAKADANSDVAAGGLRRIRHAQSQRPD